MPDHINKCLSFESELEDLYGQAALAAGSTGVSASSAYCLVLEL
jgi:hypothetical protein